MSKEEQGLPATYQAPLKSRLTPLLWLLPPFLLAMGGRVRLGESSPAWLWAFATASLAVLILTVLSVGFCKITLYPDRVERRTWFGTKVMKRSDVGGIRRRGSGLTIVFYQNNRSDGIVIPKGMGGDAVWNHWMEATAGPAEQGR